MVLYILHPGSPFRIAFLPVTISGEPVCYEHSALHWASLDELVQLPLAPSDRRFVDSRVKAASVSKLSLRSRAK